MGTKGPVTGVIHVLAPAARGGIESVVTMLAAAQREGGVAARVAAVVEPPSDGHPFCAATREAGIPCDPVGVRGRAYGAEYRALIEIFRRHAGAVVHTHGYRSDVVGGLAARRTDAPLVSTAHGFIGGDRRGRMYERVQVWSYRTGREVVAVSSQIHERLRSRGVRESRLHLIRNAWRASGPTLSAACARAELGIDPAAAFVAGWVGRVSHEKGLDVAVEALARPEAREARLCVVGDGPRLDAERRRAASRGLEDRVRWHGPVERAARIMPAFDAFLLTSRTEGTPIVLFEAMAAGVPIVATAVGGVPDVLRDEREGLIVEPADPEAVAIALARLRDDPDLARRLSDAARRRLVEEFGSERWVEAYDRVYDRAISRVDPGTAAS